MNNTLLRSISGAFFIALLSFSIIYNIWTLVSIIIVINVLGIFEFKSFFKGHESINDDKIMPILLSVGAMVLSAISAIGLIDFRFLYFLALFPVIIGTYELFKQKKQPLINTAVNLWALLYITFPLSLLPFIALNNSGYNWQIILGTFVLIWVNDTAAYCVGLIFGKHRLWEKVSPKKSWEGAIGGFVFTLLGGYLISIFWKDISFYQWIILATVTSPLAILGDLAESNIKRTLNIKDSGNIIPGHGGILDRFDAAFWVIPALFVFQALLK